MEGKKLEGTKGWLFVYLIGSVPLIVVYSMGLSGWFFDYPIVLMLAIFFFFAIPLLLILLKVPQAPLWNIAALWIAVVLMALRSLSVVVFPLASEGQPPLSAEELPGVILTLSGIVSVSLGWAMSWTKYFNGSVRVKNTFVQKASDAN